MIYTFHNYELDTNLFEFRYAGGVRQLARKSFDLLLYLIQHRGRVVSRDELLECFWPNQHVTDSSLNHCIMTVRQAINDHEQGQILLQTVRNRGYRFMAPVMEKPSLTQPPTPEPRLEFAPFPDHPSPLLGRESALTVLRTSLTLVQQGQGQVVELVGPLGIGKSRLLQEFCQQLRRQVPWIHAACPCYGRTRPFFLIRKLLQHYLAGIQAPVGFPADATTPALSTLLERAGQALHLDHLDPDVAQEHITTTVGHYLLNLSAQQPLILILEDLQWLDPSSASCVQWLVEHSSGTPLYLLLSYRPHYVPAWQLPVPTQRVFLSPLLPHESLALVRTRCPALQETSDVAQALVTHAQGIPLMLEVFARILAAQKEATTPMMVPDTLSAALAWQLKHLTPAATALLHTVTVLDGSWDEALLNAIWGTAQDISQPLQELQQEGWCYQQDTHYDFLHKQYRELLYTALATHQRQHWHEAIGHALQALAPQSQDNLPERLAYHYARAADAMLAWDTLQQATDDAVQQHAYQEAVALLQAALQWGERLPDSPEYHQPFSQRRFQLAHLLRLIGQSQEALAVLSSLQDRYAPDHNLGFSKDQLLLLGQLYSDLGQWQHARDTVHHLLANASAQDTVTQGLGYALLTMGCYYTEQHDQGIQYAQEAIMHLLQTTRYASLSWSYVLLGLHYLGLGEVQQALTATTLAQTTDTSPADRHLHASIAWATGAIYATSGQTEAALQACRQSLHLSPDPLTSALAMGWLGYTYTEQGDGATAQAYLRQAIETLQALSYQRQESLFTVFLGAAHLQAGQLLLAHKAVLRGCKLSHTNQYRTAQAWAQRLLGQIAMEQQEWALAEDHLQEALALFTDLAARLEIARTHLLFGELERSQDNPAMSRIRGTAALHMFRTLQVEPYMAQASQLLATVS